jgi:hypothetical protein
MRKNLTKKEFSEFFFGKVVFIRYRTKKIGATRFSKLVIHNNFANRMAF